jgi:hypothetical protein
MEVTMTNMILRSLAVGAVLALAACGDAPPDQLAKNGPSGQNAIDQDITATHDNGAPTLGNQSLGEAAPWRLQQRP